jgi:hypothetical protein
MKKRSGKLSLNRETLHRLELNGLRQAAGGIGPNDTSAFCDNATGCDCDDTVGYPPSACMATCSCPSASCVTRHC